MYKVSKRLHQAFRDVKQLSTRYLIKIKKIKHKRKIAKAEN